MKIIKTFDDFLEKFAYLFIVASLTIMLWLSILMIGLRWMNITFLWADQFIRHLVFFSAFLGGSLATSKKNHIRIDIIGKILEAKKLDHVMVWIDRLTNIFSFCILIWLAFAGYEFLKTEIEYGKEAFFGMHSSVLVGIIPVGMTLVGLRFLNLFLLSFSKESK